MNEAVKTSIYAGVAVVVALVAVVARPKQEPPRPQHLVGKMLFEKFETPEDATSLEIVKYDEELSELHTFRVARDNTTGAWTIPSHGGYPADAETQMRDAATSFIDLQVLGLASELPSEHKLFGVVEPNKDQLKAGDEGVGMLVTVEDKKGNDLANLIIGSKVKGTEDQYFVRIPKQDVVYAVKIEPSKFSTDFESWIEKDLLKLNSLDVERLAIKDYEVVQTVQGAALNRKSDVEVKYDSTKGDWQVEQMVTYEQGKPREVNLLDVEELDDKALNDLKSAADDLKIVDVRRKPKGLGADLEAGDDFLNNQESLESLASRGFLPARLQGKMQLFAANGEVALGMKSGIEYVLRFGNTAGSEEAGSGKMNRYLFVMARVDEEQFPEPELTPLPELPGEDAAGPKPAASDASDAASEEKPETEEAAAEGAEGKETDRTAIESERERIKKENQRKLDERNDKLEKAREEVRELNGRFSDWYYIISEDTYKKIHLDTADIVKESEDAAEKGFEVDAFRSLEQGGLKKEADKPSTPSPPIP